MPRHGIHASEIQKVKTPHIKPSEKLTEYPHPKRESMKWFSEYAIMIPRIIFLNLS
jgi:hypothetical protein